MENEFAIRKRILAEIEHARADADERAADPALDLAGRGTQTAGSYEHGADKYAPGAVTADRGAEIPSGSMAGEPVTGWEVSREKLCGKYHGQSADRSHEEHEDDRARDAEAEHDAWLDAVPRYVDLLAGLFPRPSLKGKTREEAQREIDAEREAKNIGAAMGIPLTVVLLLIQKAKADELDDARDVFAHARPGVVTLPAESVAYGDDDGEADDLDEDDENDFDYDDDGEEVYDEEDDYDPDDEDDQESGPVMHL